MAASSMSGDSEFTRRVLDSLFAFVGVLLPDGTLIDANRPPLQAAGIRIEDVRGRKFWECYWWNHSEATQKQVMDGCRRAAAGEVVRFDVQIRVAGGGMMWIDFQLAPLRDATGCITHLIPSAIDLTERRQAEARIRDSEERYRSLFSSIDEGFCVIEVLFDHADRPVDYRFLETNPAFERHTGLVDATGRRIREMVPTLDDSWFVIYGAVARTGEPMRFQNEAPAMDRIFDVYAFRVGPAQQHRVALLFKDITERAKTERAVARELHDAKRLQEVSTRLIPEGDIDTLLVAILDAAIDVMEAGLGSVQLLDPATGALHLRASHGFAQRSADRALDSDSPWLGRMALRFGRRIVISDVGASNSIADESTRKALHAAGICAGQATPLVSRSGRTLGVLATFWEQAHSPSERQLRLLDVLARQAADLIERRQGEEAQLRAKEEAESANRAKDRFLAILSHELRTPLSPVLLTVSAMENDPALPAEVREAMAMVRRNVEIEARLIDDLLDLSRVLNGKLQLDVRTVSVNAVIGHALSTCAEEAQSKGVRLLQRLEASPDSIGGDAARLQQVFWNLLKNSIKFTPTGGSIEIVSERTIGGMIRVYVRDTGMGINEAILERIFNAFDQGDNPAVRNSGGLGLGLAICKGIVDMHEGRLWALSDGDGKGATFTVEFPAISPAEGATPVASPPRIGGTRQVFCRRILLVEDHRDTAAVLSRLLRMRRHEVDVAHTTADALQLLEKQRYALLISDVGLPDRSGFELMHEVRQRYGIVGIAMSGYGMDDDVRKSREAGFIEHLVKPVNATQLEAAIGRVLHARDHESTP